MLKKILFCTAIILIALSSMAFAETDYGSMSDDELIAIQVDVSKELMKRNNIPFVFVSDAFGFHIPVSISSSDDPHIYFLPDFIGKNLASINIVDTEIGKNFYYFGPKELYSHTNGKSGLWLEVVSIDGEYIDVNDKELLKQYTIIWQSPAPNTAIYFTFELSTMSINLKEKIEDYNEPSSQSVETLTLYVVKNK